jgi:hypothetical protein
LFELGEECGYIYEYLVVPSNEETWRSAFGTKEIERLSLYPRARQKQTGFNFVHSEVIIQGSSLEGMGTDLYIDSFTF